MPGIPLGAARQHDVQPELLDYEHIAGIEFIETRAGFPFPRSAAYRCIEGGSQMRVRDACPELDELDLSEEESRAYIDALAQSGLFEWQRVYRPAQGTFVNDCTNWRLEVRFASKGRSRAARPFRVEGEGVFPDSYEAVVDLLMNKDVRALRAADGKGDAADA